MPQNRKFGAFLSFADPDRDLVECLSNLFRCMDTETYFAPRQLAKSGSAKWREQIIKGMRNSASLVPIYTRHSLNRPWVLYESGLADGCDLPRFAARVSSVAASEIEYLPGPGAFVYELFNRDHLAELIINVCREQGRRGPTVESKVHNLVQSHTLADRVVVLSSTRWVFLAGNYPTNAACPETGVRWFRTEEEYLGRLKAFVELLTQRLLDNGFSVAACPQVPAVGRHVINEAARLLAETDYDVPVDYAIGGIYPIDREARESSLSPTAKRRWREHIMSFRKSLLADREWLIVIGGNEGTSEECVAAKELKVKVLSIPCFGGTGATTHAPLGSKPESPCVSCSERDGGCGREGIGKIIEAMR